MRTFMLLRVAALVFAGVAFSVIVSAQSGEASAATEQSPRERLSFNEGWRFILGDAPDAQGTLGYLQLKPWVLATGTELINAGVPKPVRPACDPGAEVSFVRPDFDDSAWTALTLPHDWAIAGPFKQELPGETGKLPWQGTGWYRKQFTLPAGDAGRLLFLDIDGAMAFSTVWLNGRLVGGWPYGYTSYRLDLTPYANVGGENVLAVRLENPPESSRWYPGSGLYRNVWLVKTDPVHVVQGGVFVTTPRITPEAAIVNVQVELKNNSAQKVIVGVATQVRALDANGRALGAVLATSETMSVEIDPVRARDGLRSNTLTLAQPRLWDLQTPHRYVAITTLEVDGKVVDRIETPFGIRTVAWEAEGGFLLNGKRVYLQGVCMHHDLGALGATVNVRALERQLEILREMGVNAIRCSHNPSSPELLELCDRMGFLVMAEAFDAWRRGKKWPANIPEFDPRNHYHDYGRIFDDWHERDLRALIRRDRNHPSVVIWSIGNEVIEQWFSDGWKLAARLAGIVREEDRTRPLTSGFNGEVSGYNGMQTAVDAIGYNYKPWEYAPFQRRNPTIPVYGAETASTISSRGEYFFPVVDDKLQGRENFHMSSYDLFSPPWASSPDFEFKYQDENPFVAGEFVWTGFDYLGEPTPYNSDSTNLLNFSDPVQRARMAAELEKLGRIGVPSRSSYFGIVDLAGFPKDRFYLYQARWRPELPMAHILPHWNWPERVGQVTPVHVYSSGDEAELFLNGQSLGRKVRGKFEYRFRWDEVVYGPGELKVVTYKNGKPWAEAVKRTAGDAAQITLTPDRATIRGDGSDLSFVTAMVADKGGAMAPRAKHLLRFEVSGPGEIVATDNGDPTDLTAFPSKERKAFNGLALVIVRAKAGESGRITLRASGEGLAPAQIVLTSE